MVLYTTVFLASSGYMAAQSSDEGLWTLTFPQPTEEQALADTGLWPYEKVYFPENIKVFKKLAAQLDSYFKGAPLSFSIPIDWRGYTDFQAKVLKATTQIPYGMTDTYGSIAAKVDSPKSARAVGGALHINRTPIVVPCHRVIGVNGKLTGFGGGLTMKERLLNLENYK